jgi:hypothetical protein
MMSSWSTIRAARLGAVAGQPRDLSPLSKGGPAGDRGITRHVEIER